MSEFLESLAEEGMVEVKLPSGAPYYVHDSEVDYLQDRAARYLKDNKFTNVSDDQDLDRLLVEELLVHRYGTFLSLGKDYWGDAIDDKELAATVKSLSSEIRLLKKSMGLDKPTRDKERGEDSVQAWLAAVKDRARHFGYMRNEQFYKAIDLFHQLKAKITLHDNCDKVEKVEFEMQAEDVLRWLREVAIPEFDSIDEKFRKEQQQMWIKKQ